MLLLMHNGMPLDRLNDVPFCSLEMVHSDNTCTDGEAHVGGKKHKTV